MNDVLGIVTAIVFVAEIILSVIWNKGYFKVGIVVFAQESTAAATSANGRSASAFQTHFDATFRGTRMLFHEIEPGLIAFREKVLEFRFMAFHYSPIMHGIIKTDPATGMVSVRGILNWSAIPVVALFVVPGLSVIDMNWVSLVFPSVILLFLLLFYWIQFRRYRKILEFASI